MSRPSPWQAAASPVTARRRSHVHVLLAICSAPLGVALVLAYRDGGYFTTAWGPAAVVLLGLLAIAVLTLRSRMGGRLGLVATAGWTGLAVWQGLSALWADEPSASTAAMGLTLLYGAAFTLVLVASRGAATLRRMIELALLASTTVALSALGARLLPDLIGGEEHGRLSTPISYWNNLALVFAFGLVLAIGIAGDPSRGRLLRAASAATIPLFPLGVLFAQSRGALLVMVFGCLVLLAATRGRIETAWILIVTLATSLPLLVFANSQDALSANEVLLKPHDVEGRRVILALLVAGAVCALGSLAVGRLSVLVSPGRRRRTLGIAMLCTVAVVTVAALVARPPSGGPVKWADRQVESFKRYDPRARDEATTVADRLVVAAGSGRWQNWSVAGSQFRESPIAGTGAGDYRLRWAAERDIDISVRNAHSLYLEVLGESGLVGLILLLTPVAAVAIAIGATLRRRPPLPLARDMGITAAAGGAVALHLAGDWAWQMPAVVLPAVALGAAALAASAIERGAAPIRKPDRPVGGRRRRGRGDPHPRRADRSRRATRQRPRAGRERRPRGRAGNRTRGGRPRSPELRGTPARGERARRSRQTGTVGHRVRAGDGGIAQGVVDSRRLGIGAPSPG